ncbi:uncharacterized protein METZ01_LOCUS121024 [marine metagenome]|uniref:Uncharacterized protein n=1 Tax=marine metagenome TaxID=408172 RepID=A0A381XU42_9ZZZZ
MPTSDLLIYLVSLPSREPLPDVGMTTR